MAKLHKAIRGAFVSNPPSGVLLGIVGEIERSGRELLGEPSEMSHKML